MIMMMIMMMIYDGEEEGDLPLSSSCVFTDYCQGGACRKLRQRR
jgi:hypothetical protein